MRLRQVALLAVMVLPGCASLGVGGGRGVPLDVEDMRQVALAVERNVAQGERAASFGDTGAVQVPEAVAQATRQRAARSDLVDQMRDQGWLEERPDGFGYIDRNETWGDLARRQKDRYAYIVQQETDDRRATYLALREANGYKRQVLEEIQRIFYEARLRYLGAGHKYIDEQGAKAVIGQPGA